MDGADQTFRLKIQSYEGPLDLLLHLIEKNKLDIYDIPMQVITLQYLEYIKQSEELNMNLAADFLVMAATLLQIKAKMLLPHKSTQEDEDFDPREELVIRLLEYKRCKALAGELLERFEHHHGSYYPEPRDNKLLGLKLEETKRKLSKERFLGEALRLNQANQYRFLNQSDAVKALLKKDSHSVQKWVRSIWNRLENTSKMQFSELFPDRSSNLEVVSGFLGLLELMRMQQIWVEQEKALTQIMISKKEDADFLRVENSLDSIEEETYN